jgi:hypothetical protein
MCQHRIIKNDLNTVSQHMDKMMKNQSVLGGTGSDVILTHGDLWVLEFSHI